MLWWRSRFGGTAKWRLKAASTTLAQENLEGRAAEALPWLLLRYWHMDFGLLVVEGRKFDLQ
jgi:hypothetical protein